MLILFNSCKRPLVESEDEIGDFDCMATQNDEAVKCFRSVPCVSLFIPTYVSDVRVFQNSNM